MATRPNRRDLIKMGAAAGGIAVAGPIVTTFNVPAAAALTSTCGCTGGATLFRKEILWSGTTWQVTTPTAGACAPACFTGTTVVANALIDTSGGGTNSNSPRSASRGNSCDDTADEGIFLVTAIQDDGTCVGTPAGGGTIEFASPLGTAATVTAAAGKELVRVQIVACCSI